MCEQTMNVGFAAEMRDQTLVGRTLSLDIKGTSLYNKRINIRAFADRFGLLAMALFLTADIFL